MVKHGRFTLHFYSKVALGMHVVGYLAENIYYYLRSSACSRGGVRSLR